MIHKGCASNSCIAAIVISGAGGFGPRKFNGCFREVAKVPLLKEVDPFVLSAVVGPAQSESREVGFFCDIEVWCLGKMHAARGGHSGRRTIILLPCRTGVLTRPRSWWRGPGEAPYQTVR